jgi:hypothetical protein
MITEYGLDLRDQAVIFELLSFVGRFGCGLDRGTPSDRGRLLGAASGDVLKFLGQFDIRRENDMASIPGRGGGVADEPESLGHLHLALLDPAIFLKRLLGGIENEEAGIAIQEDVVAAR